MKTVLLFCCICFISFTSFAGNKTDTLYSHAFGNKKNPAIIFLHDGPGNNAVAFEYSTAQMLADSGFYVIVYDQRGVARSKMMDSMYSFSIEEAVKGLDTIYKRYYIKNAILLCHGGGALIASKFANNYPKKVKKILLLSAPINYGKYYRNIFDACYKNYTSKSYSYGLYLLDSIAKMDTTSAAYAYNCVMNGLFAELYTQHNETEDAIALYNKIGSIRTVSRPDPFAFRYFYTKNKLAATDITVDLRKIISNKIPVYGIYGNDDGTFNQSMLNELKLLVGAKRVVIVDNAGHNVFMDQQEIFLKTVVKFIRQ